ncbi:hypothetical protein HDU76_003698 [Blyttiomyces sp. JEL0837]|nr:hypothetical protein HDU76_003698 [Blyttiomyces sp. JEL0837]
MSTVTGTITTPTGERVIAESRRPDGTVRKERKVRPGFLAEEEVTRYTNARIESAKVPAGYVPGLGVVNKPPGASGGVVSSDAGKSKNAVKNAKKKANKAAGGGDGDDAETTTAAPASTSSTTKSDAPAPSAALVTAADIEKKIKAAKKKLRQIEELEAKPEADLIPEQKEKLSKKSEVENDVKTLEEQLAKLQV